MSCLELSRRLLNLAITPFASEPELECAWIACTQIEGSSVMQEENALSQAPERRSPELSGASLP